jgi:GNAT superfamily N-acetyltransferase
MKIEIVNLKGENLRDAPEWKTHPFSCKYCVYWEFPEECTDSAREDKEDMFKKKLVWLENANKVFGNCGKILYANEIPIGYAQYAPGELLPHSVDYHSGPVSVDAVLISCLFIPNEEYRRLGIGTRLLHNIIEDLRKRGIRAVETYARKGSHNNPSGPVEFYLKNEFKIIKDDIEFPLMRLAL